MALHARTVLPTAAGAIVLGALAGAVEARGAVRCHDPQGHRVTQCRIAKHGTKDLSRQGWRAKGKEVTFSVRVTTLSPNLQAGGRREWPLTDSLDQPLGAVAQQSDGRLTLTGTNGATYRVTSIRVRGRGCIADPARQRTHALLQVIARGPASGGTQGFAHVDALDRSAPDGQQARRAFARQRGTGCGPSGPERGKLRPLHDPGVGKTAHARLGNGELNSVTEYDAKPEFGNIVYFATNTTSVYVGGVARGMVRTGTPVAKVDQFTSCDPNSDGTLTWRYLAIRTGLPRRPRIYGWVPARCK